MAKSFNGEKKVFTFIGYAINDYSQIFSGSEIIVEVSETELMITVNGKGVNSSVSLFSFVNLGTGEVRVLDRASGSKLPKQSPYVEILEILWERFVVEDD